MKKTLSVFLALVMMFSCFAVSFVSGAADEVTPVCNCENHIDADGCNCCVYCPNLDNTALTSCVIDRFGRFDPGKVGYCVDKNGKLVKCDDCTGLKPCNCGHDCCHPCEDHVEGKPCRCCNLCPNLDKTCRCTDHDETAIFCNCCVFCPKLDKNSLTLCKTDKFGDFDSSLVGYCIDKNGKRVECKECTGVFPCNCGHACCHPFPGHTLSKITGCHCSVSCPNKASELDITKCVKDAEGNLDVSLLGKCYNIVDGEKVYVDCNKCTGVYPCNCGHDCCHPCESHVEEKDACRCCAVCPNLNPKVLLTRCVQDKEGKLDKANFGYCIDENGVRVKCDKCTGVFPCECGHGCCNTYDDISDEPGHNNDPILNEEQQQNFTAVFQQFLRSVKDFFDQFFDVIFIMLGIKR